MRLSLPSLLLLSACSTLPLDEPSRAEVMPSGPMLIVGFRGAPQGALDRGALRAAALLPSIRVGLFPSPQGSAQQALLQRLATDPNVAWVELDQPVYAATKGQDAATDPYRTYQWNLDLIGASEANKVNTGKGVVVAVLDTGVSSGPLDGIDGLLEGWDFVNEDGDPADDNGHGTHVAGTIAQNTGNGMGVAGIAPDAALLPVKVLDADGSGWTSVLVQGIAYAVAEGADVINMSLGTGTHSRALDEALSAASDAGVLLVAASGNDGEEGVMWPAAHRAVIAVGASDGAGARAPYSNTGPQLDLIAPGGDLGEDLDGDGVRDGILQETVRMGGWDWYLFQGTSMATPHVAATGALLMAEGATAQEARAAMLGSALDLEGVGRDDSTGAGLLQADAAMDLLLAGNKKPEAPPEDDTSPPSIGSVRLTAQGTVLFETDEPTASWICSDTFTRCVSASEVPSTLHQADPGDLESVLLFAEDEAGNTAMAGPYRML
ncbi:MAG: peptidase S8 [Deltaproteobacteria bacterium]|nr:peptidase S8 [Deltaproteobacteria bacterium]